MARQVPPNGTLSVDERGELLLRCQGASAKNGVGRYALNAFLTHYNRGPH
ncbi:MAG: hypothetical protein J6A24_06180 [Clostridia bacterium]|nr:hypothetical protein [Clostridia bacterium]